MAKISLITIIEVECRPKVKAYIPKEGDKSRIFALQLAINNNSQDTVAHRSCCKLSLTCKGRGILETPGLIYGKPEGRVVNRLYPCFSM